ncbi:hypothetical protein HB785_10280 [Listeria welshimeri]|nr:hypothetical protein [Listeria welshimeri]MBC1364712.1 hypothetical protein [Listeria welshimeri]MBC1388830.1 hypothetical protein [Listeria welshimeri]MBC1396578.1 hypothetical protein [Listeria welshimeri]MBC2280047.1 hypothetical protein [Listeria welshimeri]
MDQNKIGDLSPLSSLTKIQVSIYINKNQISDVDSLSDLTLLICH